MVSNTRRLLWEIKMQLITTLDDSSYQEVSYILESGVKTTLTLRFLPTQRRWLLDVVDENGFEVHGLYVCCHPNLLDKWHNIIDYGINVATSDMVDPYRQEDFESGYAFLAMIDKEEKDYTTRYLNGLQS